MGYSALFPIHQVVTRMSFQQENGRWGEDLAVDYLVKLGLEIIVRNWRYKRAEIDIICREAGILVFVEVKTRSGISFGRPEEMVGHRKKRLLFGAASAYMYKTGYEGEIRFDIISIVGEPGKPPEIQYFRDAYYPGQSSIYL